MYRFDEDWLEGINGLRKELVLQAKNRGNDLARMDLFRSPVCDMYETDNLVVAKFELPGVNKANIDINVADDFVEVKVKQNAEQKQENKKMGFYRYESRSSQFFRRVPMPANVKAENATAAFSNGILRIEIPKVKQLEEKKTKVLIK
jgi:HSP20 family protein